MGASLNCCNYDKKDKKSSIEELNLEDTNQDFYIQNEKMKKATLNTLHTQEHMGDLQESPKFKRDETKKDFINHIKKASDNLHCGISETKLNSEEIIYLKLSISNYLSEQNDYFTLFITPDGYINSNREKDGYVYFGSVNDEVNELDIILPNVLIKDDRIYGRHFCLLYNQPDFTYYLKELGQGAGVFYRINSEVILRNNAVINLDDVYICVSILEEDKLLLKCFLDDGNETLETM